MYFVCGVYVRFCICVNIWIPLDGYYYMNVQM